jgi:hypothetical protein
MEQFLPALRGAAHAIVEAFHRPGAQPAESPGAQRDGKIRSLT